MKWLLAILIAIFLTLQYRLWVGEGSYAHRARLQQEIARQQDENTRQKDRNRVLAVQVENLKNGLDVIEERARSDMGMIKEGETFFMTRKPQ